MEPDFSDGGNGILWQAEYEIIDGRPSNNMYHRQLHFLSEYHRTKGDESKTDQNFSLDNMTGVICWLKKFDNPNKDVPLLGHHSLHPKDFFFFLYAKYPIIGFWFLWIPMIAMIHSCWKTYKVRNGNKMIATDGKILAFTRIKAFDLKITGILCDYIILKHSKFKNWKEVFDLYHGDRFGDRVLNYTL